MARTNWSVRRLFATALGVASALALSSIAWAAIASTSGQMTKIASPPSVELHMLESNTAQLAFDERQCVTLLAPLKVSIKSPGLYDESIDMVTGTIPAGTKVSSHFVQTDKVGIGGPQIFLEGTMTTDAPILGIIVRAAHLNSSDFLGAIGTVYPTGSTGHENRPIEKRGRRARGGSWHGRRLLRRGRRRRCNSCHVPAPGTWQIFTRKRGLAGLESQGRRISERARMGMGAACGRTWPHAVSCI